MTLETHIAGLTDWPTVRRLVEHPITLENESALTEDIKTTSGSLLSGILLPARGLCTVITRGDNTPVVAGQLKLRVDDVNAHLTYLAPAPTPEDDPTPWLHALDALAREAGKLHAHALIAEIEEDSALFNLLRAGGYAVYARQQVWMRRGLAVNMPPRLKLREEAQTDLGDVYALINATVPRMVQPVAMPASDMPRLVYRQDGQLMAYIAYSAGKRGVYVIPYLHPEVLPDAAAILDAALQMIAPATHLPVSVVIRRYQDWLGDALARLGFAPHTEQALMVKHLTAGVRTSSFATLHERLDGVRAKPHTQSYGSLSRAR
jgi:hypothetical protein